MIIIDGTAYNIGVKSMKRTGEFLDKYAKHAKGLAHRNHCGSFDRIFPCKLCARCAIILSLNL